MPSYENGSVYVIRNNVNDLVYVGSTTIAISQRMAQHRENAKCADRRTVSIYKAFKEIGVENFYIELVERWPCNAKAELNKREGYWMREFNSVKNGYNMHLERGYTNAQSKERRKEYYAENKETLAPKYKAYAAAHKDNIAAYRAENRRDLLAQRKEYRAIPENQVKIKEYRAAWHENNRDEKNRERREARAANPVTDEERLKENAKKRERYAARKAAKAQAQTTQ